MQTTPNFSIDDGPFDPVTEYAVRVAAGLAPAGPYVRGACQRHLEDLRTAEARGLYFDIPAVHRVIKFFRKILRVLDTIEQAYVPFRLLDWQAFIVGSLFGWKKRDGFRRFTEAYCETGKGSGKSPLAAGIGHYMLVADGEMAPEIYAAATQKDQAMVLFRDAVAMRDTSPKLRSRLRASGANPVWQLNYPKKRGFFKPISKEEGRSGPRPSCALVDEVHEHKNGDVILMLKAGFKFRQQPLMFQITNSGSDVETVCYELHEHGVHVSMGEIEDDEFFAYICAVDEGDDPLNDETCWAKANPSIGQTISMSYLRKQVADAKALPSRQNGVLRYNFCQWTEAPNTWLTRDVWRALEHDDLVLETRFQERCWLGIDLSYGDDLTALAAVFPWTRADGETIYDLFLEFWKPDGLLAEHQEVHRVNYRKWVDQGHLNAPPGVRLKLGSVARRLKWYHRQFRVMAMAFDQYRIKDLEADLQAEGVTIPMVPHPQGFRRQEGSPLWMPESVQQMENAAVEGRIRTPPHPVLRWNVMSATLREDPSGVGNKHLDKRRSKGKIDGAVASAQAIGAAFNNVDATWRDDVMPKGQGVVNV